MITRSFSRGLAMAALLFSSFSAHAFLITNTGAQAGNPPGDLYDVKITDADIGNSFDVFWTVPTGTIPTLTRDLSANMTVTVNAFTANTLDLGISITNTTDISGGFQANILSFGFGVDPDATPTYLTPGTIFDGIGSGNGPQETFPGGFKQIDMCAFSQNCSGGNVNGGLVGGGASDSMVIRLTSDVLDDFIMGGSLMTTLMSFPLKFQTGVGSFEPAGMAVPVPAALWLLGSGLLGLGVFARRKA